MKDIAESIMLKQGLTGAKPPAFCRWVFEFRGAEPRNTLDDLFPGTGIVGETWRTWYEEQLLA